MTFECLDSLLASDWPADRLEIVLVDNGSLDDVVERVAARRPLPVDPHARTARQPRLRRRLQPRHRRCPATTSSSRWSTTTPPSTPGWLRAMVPVAGADRPTSVPSAPRCCSPTDTTASSSTSPTPRHLVKGEHRMLGVRVSGVRLDGERVDDRLAFDEGFHGAEPPAAPRRRGDSPAGRARRRALRIAVDVDARARVDDLGAACRVSSRAPSRCGPTSLDGAVTHVVTVDREPDWVDVAIPPEPFDVINNVGSNLFAGGYGGDRGFLEVDPASTRSPPTCSPGAGERCCCVGATSTTSALFDERFFLYYEDTDLSWRGPAAGLAVRLRARRGRPSPSRRSRRASGSTVLPLLHRTQPPPHPRQERAAPARPGGRGSARSVGASTHHDSALRDASADAPAPGAAPEVAHRWRVLPGLPSPPARRCSRDRWSPGAVPCRATTSCDGRSSSGRRHDRRPTAACGSACTTSTGQTLGGGEQVDGSIAQVLAADHDVTLLGPAARRRRRHHDAARCRPVGLRITVVSSTTPTPARPAPTSTCSSTAPTSARRSTGHRSATTTCTSPARCRPGAIDLRSRLGIVGVKAMSLPPTAAAAPHRGAGRVRSAGGTRRVRADLHAVPRQLAVHAPAGSSSCGALRPTCCTRPFARAWCRATRHR